MVNDLKLESLHRDNKIGILESTVDFNSKMINKLQRVQNEVVGILESSYSVIKSNFNEISLELRELQLNFACLSASMGYFKLEKLVHNIMSELKNLFNGNFDSRILTPEVKHEICIKIIKAGIKC